MKTLFEIEWERAAFGYINDPYQVCLCIDGWYIFKGNKRCSDKILSLKTALRDACIIMLADECVKIEDVDVVSLILGPDSSVLFRIYHTVRPFEIE